MIQGASFHPARAIAVNQILLPSAARIESGTGEATRMLEGLGVLFLQFDVADTNDTADDTLDVFVQTTIDGTNWIDVYHFTQVLGNGGAKRYFGKLVADAAMTEFENATALGAAAGRAILGDQYRVRWAIVDADDPSFTFSVVANGLT